MVAFDRKDLSNDLLSIRCEAASIALECWGLSRDCCQPAIGLVAKFSFTDSVSLERLARHESPLFSFGLNG